MIYCKYNGHDYGIAEMADSGVSTFNLCVIIGSDADLVNVDCCLVEMECWRRVESRREGRMDKLATGNICWVIIRVSELLRIIGMRVMHFIPY